MQQVHYNIAKLQADRGEGDYAIYKYRLAIEWVLVIAMQLEIRVWELFVCVL